MSSSLVLSACWALALLGAYWFLPRIPLPKIRSTRWAFIIVAVVALTARLVPNLLLPMGARYDIESYRIVGNLVLQGKDVYASPEAVNRHPYLPLQMYWMAFALWSAETFHLPFVKIVRMAPIGADVGIALMLFAFLRQLDLSSAFYGGLSYALNPIPIFVSAYHGQFDSIPALCTLLALYWLDKSPLAAGGWLGLGILSKSWPVLALPSLLAGTQGWRKRLYLLGAAIAVPLAGVGAYTNIFHASPQTVIERALGYNWGVGVWGYTYPFHMLSVLKPDFAAPFHWLIHNGRYLTLLALGAVWMIRARKEVPRAGILTIWVAFFAVTHAFSIQYLMWVVPFAVLNQERQWLTRYTLGAFAYMFLAYMTLILEMHITRLLPWPKADWFIIMPSGLPAWGTTVGWTVRRLLKKRGQT